MVARIMPDTNKLRSFSMDGYLYHLLEGHKNAVLNHNTSLVVVIDGRSGLGKTTLANQVCMMLSKDYNLQKIHYNPTSFLEGDESGKVGLANAKKGDCIVFDEAMLISSRSALSSINKMIIQSMSMIRSKQIFVVFCVNSIFDLDKNLAISRADLLLHVYGNNLVDRGQFVSFYKPKNLPDKIKQLYIFGKKTYSYNIPRGNFKGRFSKDFIVDEKKYEAQKNKGVTDFLKNLDKKYSERGIVIRDKLIFYLREKHKTKTSEIMEITGLSRPNINKIIARLSQNPQTQGSNRYL